MTEDHHSAPQPKDRWDKLRAVAPLVASIAVPVVVAWVGGSYNAGIKASENRARYVELAIAQLRTPPTPETEALRNWAVELLDSQAPIKLSTEAKRRLRSHQLEVKLHGNAASQADAEAALSAGETAEENGAILSAPGRY